MYPYPYTWNGPVCPGCQRPYLQPTVTFTTFMPKYQPRHRKPGPAQ